MMADNGNSDRQPNDFLNTTVDDEIYAELVELEGQQIVYVTLWEESLADLAEGQAPAPDDQTIFDIDLYLHDGIYFELYGTLCYPDIEALPLADRHMLAEFLSGLIARGIWLQEVDVDEEDSLVLGLGRDGQIDLYLVVGGWSVDEWQQLPDDI